MMAVLFSDVDKDVFKYVPGYFLREIPVWHLREILVRALPRLTQGVKKEGWGKIIEVLDEEYNEKRAQKVVREGLKNPKVIPRT